MNMTVVYLTIKMDKKLRISGKSNSYRADDDHVVLTNVYDY